MDRSTHAEGVHAFGPFRLDPVGRTLIRDGAPVTLTPTVMETLLFLLENPDRVVSKDELLVAIWPGRIVEESNISQTIFTLRRALGDTGAVHRFIVTAPGRGYRFVGPVQRVFEPSPAARARLWRPGPIGFTAPEETISVLPEGAVLNGLFEVLRLVGRGDIAAVYEGVNITTRERVAIKSVHPSVAESPAVRAAFLAEMRVLTRLGHPAIANYRMAAREPTLGVLYIVQEFVDGIALDALIGHVTIPEAKLRGLSRRLAEGLKHAHDLGVVHRMLAPENILVPGGRLDACLIVGFGLAEDLNTLRSPQIAGDRGAWRYAAPEQFGDFGGEVGAWTDVYSLGLVMLALATGIRPDNASALPGAEERRRAGPDLSQAPHRLRPLFARMLEPNPKLRFRSTDDLLSALDEKRNRGKRPVASPLPG